MTILDDEIIGINPLGRATVYDIEVDEDHSYVANNIITHNSSHP